MAEFGLGSNNEVWDVGDIDLAVPMVDAGFQKFKKACGGVTVNGDFLVFDNDACNGILVNVSLMTLEGHLRLMVGDRIVFSGKWYDMLAAKSMQDVVEQAEIILGRLFSNQPMPSNEVGPDFDLDNLLDDDGDYDDDDDIW